MLLSDMDLKLILGIVSFFVTTIAIIPYIIDTIKGKTIPHIYSWLIWGILQTIAVIAQIKNGAGYGSLYGVASTLSCFLVVFLSLKNGFKNIKIFDTICLILAIISIIIYIRLDNPLLALIMAIVTNFIGLLPTLRKTYIDPLSETMVAYLIGTVGAFLSILALQNYTIITCLYLVYIILSNSLLVMIMILKKPMQVVEIK